MSVEALSWVLNRSATKGSTRLVLLALANEASTSGEVSAYARSYTHLARMANVSKSTVWRAIEDAVAMGELEVTRSGGGRERNDYRIVMGDCEVQPVAGSNRLQDEVAATAPCSASDCEVQSQRLRDEVAITPLLPVDPVLTQNTDPTNVAPKRKRSRSERPVVGDDGFDEFWSKYPRRNGVRVGKAAALDRWRRIPLAARPRTMAALDAYAAHCAATDRYPKDAERWLRDWEQWLEVDVAAKPDAPVADRSVRIRNGVTERFIPGAGWCAETRPRELADYEL